MSLDQSRGDPPFTFHLVPRRIWHAAAPDQAYEPESLAREAFIHCTDGSDELAATANRHFSTLREELVVLVLDRSRVAAPVRYDDARRVYPHLYGPLNRDAIVAVVLLTRAADGSFLPSLDVPATVTSSRVKTD